MTNRGKKNGNSNFYIIIGLVLGILSIIPIIWSNKIVQPQIVRGGGAGSRSTSINVIKMIFSSILIIAGIIFYKKIVAVKDIKEKEYDEKILKKAVAELAPGAIFSRDKYIGPETLYEKGIIPNYSIFKQPGMLSYQKDGKKYCFSNIHLLRYREDKNERGYYDTIYEGQVYTVNYATELQGTVRVFATRKMAVVKVETNDGYAGRKPEETKVETENVMFNDNFNVYATCKQSAFYVLSPYVMEQLLEMKKKYKQIGVYIGGNSVLITLKTDSFLLSKKMYFEKRAVESLQEAKAEVKEVLKMAEILENTINGSIKNNFINN